MIQRLAILGVGLIGGSLARALKKVGHCQEIIGWGHQRDSLDKALALGVIDRATTSLAEAVAEADVVVLATPVGVMADLFKAMAPHLRAETTVTDVGSTKGSVVEAAQAAFPVLPKGFVPGHPIAGTEKNGVEASFAELFQKRRVIITPVASSDRQAVATVRAMWLATGAEVVEMEVRHHDEVLAATSHLPHVLAFALVDSLARMDTSEEIFKFAAGGFRDFTRIASSDPTMWRDICLANDNAIVAVIDRFREDLEMLREAIKRDDSDKLLEVFGRAKRARDKWCG